jgi:hypothetical protein
VVGLGKGMRGRERAGRVGVVFLGYITQENSDMFSFDCVLIASKITLFTRFLSTAFLIVFFDITQANFCVGSRSSVASKYSLLKKTFGLFPVKSFVVNRCDLGSMIQKIE